MEPEGIIVQQIIPALHNHATDGITSMPEVPIDIYRFFGADFNLPTEDVVKLEEISTWALGKEDSIGDALIKLRNLEVKLGMPRGNETRYDKIFNWVKMQKAVEEIQKRQDSLTT